MLCFDNNLLADYLDGEPPARKFLEQYDDDVWAVPSLALFEAYMGAIHGLPRGSIDDVYAATRGFEVLPLTDETARSAARLQSDLKDDGLELDNTDAIMAAAAHDAGAAFATNEKTFRKDPVRDRIDVAVYER
jgi:predicted nucleic acid-binding protein